MSFFIFVIIAKKLITKKSTSLHIPTLYHLWMIFKTKNHTVYVLGFWLQAPKGVEIRIFSPSYVLGSGYLDHAVTIPLYA